MFTVALISALLLGVVLGFDAPLSPQESDAPDIDPDALADQPDPITPVPDPAGDTNTDTDDQGSVDAPFVLNPDPVFIPAGQSLTGTDGNDRVSLIAGGNASVPVTITGGDGDDTLELTDPNNANPNFSTDFVFESANVDAGNGNDTIRISASNSTISGGAGNDMIELLNIASTTSAFGGDGDDTLVGAIMSQDPVGLHGGAGNDLIDARMTDNAVLTGGTGNDKILFSGLNSGGAGYVISVDGGAGDDTLSYEGSAITFDEPDENPISTHGGTGADLFEIQFDEGGTLDRALEDGQSMLSLDVIILPDFEPGVDRIEVEPTVRNDAFEITAARLQEDTVAGTTDMIISYDSATELDREITVAIGATGVSFDDITFVGVDEAVLTAARRTSL